MNNYQGYSQAPYADAAPIDDSGYIGKRQYPQNRRQSDVIVEDPDYVNNATSGYTGSKKVLGDSSAFIQQQRQALQRISETPMAGVIKKYNPDEKNWAVYDESAAVPIKAKALDRGNSRSLVNDDINGAQPKRYGSSSSALVNSFAGVSSGIKERLQNREVPWGSGENFEHTKYGSKKWAEKPNRYPAHHNVPVVKPIRPPQVDSLDQERERIESRGMGDARNNYQEEQPQVNSNNMMEQDAYAQQLNEVKQPEAPGGSSYMEQKRKELERYLAEKQNSGMPSGPAGPSGPSHQPARESYEDKQTREAMKQQMEYEIAMEMQKMREENDNKLNEQENYAPKEDYKGQYGGMDNYSYNPPAPESYKSKIVPLKNHNGGGDFVAGGKPKLAGGEANQFSIADHYQGYGGNDGSTYQTTSNQYGGSDGPEKKPSIAQSRIHGKMTPQNEKGFNVITGEYSG